MRVLQLLKTGHGGSWAVRQMVELRRHGIAVHVAMPDGPMVAQCRDAGCHVHVVDVGLPLRTPRAIPATLARFRRLVDEVEPDVLHSHFVSTTLTMRLALGDRHPVPRIFQVPGPLHLENPLLARAEIAAASAPDVWIASCEWTRTRYQALVHGCSRSDRPTVHARLQRDQRCRTGCGGGRDRHRRRVHDPGVPRHRVDRAHLRHFRSQHRRLQRRSGGRGAIDACHSDRNRGDEARREPDGLPGERPVARSSLASDRPSSM